MFINTPEVLNTESSLAFGLPAAEGMLQSVSRHRWHFAGIPITAAVFMQKHNTGSHKTHSALHMSPGISPRLFPIFPLPFLLLPFVLLLFRISLISIRATNTCSHPKGSPGSPELPGKSADCASPAASWPWGGFLTAACTCSAQISRTTPIAPFFQAQW